MKTLKDTNLLAYEEWMIKNKKSVDKVSYGSKYKAWFKCRKCEYEWEAIVYNRSKGQGCPACANRVITEDNCFAINCVQLLSEWADASSPFNFTVGSNALKKWKCCVCGYIWKARIVDRVQGRGCASCAGQVANDYNRLTTNNPKSIADWDYEKNFLKPECFSYKSNKRAFWVCSMCEYKWNSTIINYSLNGCPKCSGKTIPNEENCLKNDHLLMKFWSSKNKISPDKIHKRSGKSFWWDCKKCNHEWRQSPHQLASLRGCPNCASGSRVSKMALEWLKLIDPDAIPEQLININGRKIWVDGYNYTTKTAYEFFGDYWHGNPKIYNGIKRNATNGELFSKLYQDTLDRINLIKSSGLKLVYIWEREWKEIKKSL